MRQDHDFFQRMLDNLHDGVYFVDRDRVVNYWNKGAARLSGFSADEVLGHGCRDNLLVHVDEAGRGLCRDGCPLKATLQDGKERQADVFMRHKDGHRVPVTVRAAPMRDADGTIIGAVEIFSDNTTRTVDLQRIEELKQLAFLDALTGIANRRFLENTLSARLDELRRYGWPFGVMFMDVDKFKTFNDVHGHEVGDQVLKMVSKTMASCSRAFDTVGRWGGEEFVAITANVDHDKLALVAERYRQVIQHSGLPADGQLLHVTVSIGAALARSSDTAESLLARADALMYRSKQDGRNRVTMEGPLSEASVARA